MSISPGQAHDRAAKGQAGLSRKWLDLAAGDLELAEQLKHEHYRRMQRKSALKRRQKRAARVAAEERALRAAGMDFVTEAELAAALADLARQQVKR
jgi:hypothetical protein